MQAFYENKQEKIYFSNAPERILQCNPHLHYHVEIAFIKEGKTEILVDTSASAFASDGDVVLVFPNQIHAFRTLYPEKHILLIVDPHLFPEYSSLFSDRIPRNNILKDAFNDDEVAELIKSIERLYKEPRTQYSDVALRGYILALMSKLFSFAKFKKISSEDMHSIGSVINYCISNYDKNLSLDVLEKELHISKYYISHIMNQKLHMSFNDYINSIRISNACRYLTESNYSISDISALVGFNTTRTFNRAFQKHMGISPREYKNKDVR